MSLLLGSRKAILLRAGILIAIIALADWKVEGEIPLGFLYLFPMLLAGSACSRWQIALIAALCTFLTELFDSFAWLLPSGIPRDILIFAAFLSTGLFVNVIVRSRQLLSQHLDRIEKEIAARREAEEQMKILIESSPAAVFTTGRRRFRAAGQRCRASLVRGSSGHPDGPVDSRLSSGTG